MAEHRLRIRWQTVKVRPFEPIPNTYPIPFLGLPAYLAPEIIAFTAAEDFEYWYDISLLFNLLKEKKERCDPLLCLM